MPRRRLQTGFSEKGEVEVSVSDAELINALGEHDKLLDAWEDGSEGEPSPKEIAGDLRKSKNQIKAVIKRLELQPGQYRVGEYVFSVKTQAGGGFKVEAWEALTFELGSFGANDSNGSAAAD